MNDETEREPADVDVEPVDLEVEAADDDPVGADEDALTDGGSGSPAERIRELEARIEETHDQLLRKQAELINYRKRVERERTETSVRARTELLRELLPIFDDLERAVSVESDDVESYRQGVELILRSIEALMDRLDVERIFPEGEPFDPEYHEAMARVESDDVAEGHVLEVYQPGWVMGDRLVRPARVVVAMASGDGGESGQDGGAERDEYAGGRERADG